MRIAEVAASAQSARTAADRTAHFAAKVAACRQRLGEAKRDYAAEEREERMDLRRISSRKAVRMEEDGSLRRVRRTWHGRAKPGMKAAERAQKVAAAKGGTWDDAVTLVHGDHAAIHYLREWQGWEANRNGGPTAGPKARRAWNRTGPRVRVHPRNVAAYKAAQARLREATDIRNRTQWNWDREWAIAQNPGWALAWVQVASLRRRLRKENAAVEAVTAEVKRFRSSQPAASIPDGRTPESVPGRVLAPHRIPAHRRRANFVRAVRAAAPDTRPVLAEPDRRTADMFRPRG